MSKVDRGSRRSAVTRGEIAYSGKIRSAILIRSGCANHSDDAPPGGSHSAKQKFREARFYGWGAFSQRCPVAKLEEDDPAVALGLLNEERPALAILSPK